MFHVGFPPLYILYLFMQTLRILISMEKKQNIMGFFYLTSFFWFISEEINHFPFLKKHLYVHVFVPSLSEASL